MREPTAPGPPDGKAERILVVEKDLDTADALAHVLHEMGHRVEFAINGRLGLEVARRFQPTVVFVGCALPDMPARDFTRALLEGAAIGAPRLFAVLENGSEEAQRDWREAGCRQYLLKPVNFSAIDSALRSPGPSADPSATRLTSDDPD